jgi:hypothetical protein
MNVSILKQETGRQGKNQVAVRLMRRSYNVGNTFGLPKTEQTERGRILSEVYLNRCHAKRIGASSITYSASNS